MNAAATFAAWKEFARSHNRAGGDNIFWHNGSLYCFDANPRPLLNGSLQGRICRQDRSQAAQDIGGFKINGDGSIASLPQELHGVLPTGAPTINSIAIEARHAKAFAWEDTQ
jgi:hypothetical protein